MTDNRHDKDASERANPAGIAPPAGIDGDDEISLLDYWQILRKRRWVVLGITGIALFIALVGTLLTTSEFRATTSLQIDRDTIQVVQVQGLQPVESFNDQNFYQTQYDLLRSRSLAQRVVAQLDLAHNPEFKRLMRPSPWAKLLALMHPASKTKPGNAARDDQLDSALLAMVSIEPVLNSRLVKIHIVSPDPAFSARVANAYAQAFIQSNLERRMDASSYAKRYLQDHLQQLKQRLEDSDQELVAFAQKQQIVNISNQQSLVGQQLEDLNKALADAEQDRYKAESRWREVQATPTDALPQVLGDPVVQKLRQKYSEIAAKYQDQLRLYKPAYPQMQQLKAQLDELHGQIAVQIAAIKRSVEGDYLAAKAREDLLHTRVADLKQQVLDLEQRSIRYNILKREVDTNRQLYDGLLQRYKEIAVAGGVGINNISVVDRAEVPTGRYSPSLKRNFAIALVIGLFGGALLALLLEHLDDTVKGTSDIEQKLGLAVLGIIPLLRDQTPEQALTDARSGFSEAYRSSRTALQFSTADGAPQVLLITSTQPGEGKSTTASALAKNFAELGRRVLLIDADLRNPSQHRIGVVDNARGLSNVLAGAMTWREVLHRAEGSSVSVMACGPLPPNPAELLAGPRLAALLEAVRAEFDFVILDSPPVLGLADAPLLGHIAGGTVLVIEAGTARLEDVRDAVKRLEAARGRVVGAVMTKLDMRHARYGYGYGYGYGGPSEPGPGVPPRAGALAMRHAPMARARGALHVASENWPPWATGALLALLMVIALIGFMQLTRSGETAGPAASPQAPASPVAMGIVLRPAPSPAAATPAPSPVDAAGHASLPPASRRQAALARPAAMAAPRAPATTTPASAATAAAVSEGAPAAHALAEPVPAAIPGGPATGPAAAAGAILNHFVSSYDSADLRGLMALFAPDARGYNGSLADIGRHYSQLFARTFRRNLHVYDVLVRPGAHGTTDVHLRYNDQMLFRGRSAAVTFSGVLHLVLRPGPQGLRIVQLMRGHAHRARR